MAEPNTEPKPTLEPVPTLEPAPAQEPTPVADSAPTPGPDPLVKPLNLDEIKSIDSKKTLEFDGNIKSISTREMADPGDIPSVVLTESGYPEGTAPPLTTTEKTKPAEVKEEHLPIEMESRADSGSDTPKEGGPEILPNSDITKELKPEISASSAPSAEPQAVVTPVTPAPTPDFHEAPTVRYTPQAATDSPSNPTTAESSSATPTPTVEAPAPTLATQSGGIKGFINNLLGRK